MEAIQIHTRATNGRVTFELPAKHAGLANASLLVMIVPEPTASTPVGETNWELLAAAYADFEGHDPYPTIIDPVAWQQQLRADDERELQR